jgi:hypothetical protein
MSSQVCLLGQPRLKLPLSTQNGQFRYLANSSNKKFEPEFTEDFDQILSSAFPAQSKNLQRNED